MVENKEAGEAGLPLCSDNTNEKMLKSIMDTIVETDYEFAVVIDGNTMHTKRYSVANPRICMFQQFDEDYEAVIRQYFRQNTLLEEAEHYIAVCKMDFVIKQLQDARSYRVTYSRVRADGSVRQKQLNYSFMNRKRKMVLCTRTDVTSAVEAEREKNQKLSQALEIAKQASLAKTDFLSRMSHDIRTPMNAIIGLTEIALDEQSGDNIKGCLKKIEHSSKFLLGLINDILDISKIEAGKLKLNPEAYSLKEFESVIDTIIRPMMEEKRIHFQYEMPEGNPFIYEDKLRFNQIFINLLSNAAKYTQESGKVSFTARELGKGRDVSRMQFQVEDNGMGMSPAFLQHAFEPFEQEQNGIIQQFQGTGLGLSIARQLVYLMDGTIQIESQENVGTKVTVILPIPLVEEKEKTVVLSQSLPQQPLTGRRILLVEDNKINTVVAERLLEKGGAQVEHAKDGGEAVKMFQNRPPYYYNGVLMDIRMPVMNGLEATRTIRRLAKEDAKSIPIIAMSANAYQEDVKKSLNAGMNEHLSKPVEPRRLYETLTRFLT